MSITAVYSSSENERTIAIMTTILIARDNRPVADALKDAEMIFEVVQQRSAEVNE
jgi:hypothetical protein